MKRIFLILTFVIMRFLCVPIAAAETDWPEVWMIGEFNEWQVPTETDNNGARKLDINSLDQTYVEYVYEFYSSEIKPKIVFYYMDPEGKGIFVCSFFPPVSLYGSTSNPNAQYATVPMLTENLEIAKDNPYEVINVDDNRGQWYAVFVWNIDASEPYACGLIWDGAPFDNPLSSYSQKLCIESDSGEIRLDYNALNTEYDDYEFVIAEDSKIHLEVGDYRWSCDQGYIPKLANNSETFHIGPSEDPIEINCDRLTKVKAVVYKNWHIMDVWTEPVDVDETDCLYIVGYYNDWQWLNDVNTDGFKKLERIAPGVYEAIVNFPGVPDDEKALFHFIRKIDGDQTEYSLGAALYDTTAQVEFNEKGEYESPITWSGVGNWQFTDWGLNAKVNVRVDLNNLTLHLTNMDLAGRESATLNESACIYYNLLGCRVDNPIKGIYIRVNGTNIEKVRL